MAGEVVRDEFEHARTDQRHETGALDCRQDRAGADEAVVGPDAHERLPERDGTRLRLHYRLGREGDAAGIQGLDHLVAGRARRTPAGIARLGRVVEDEGAAKRALRARERLLGTASSVAASGA
jgi:hypothetical protein